MASAWITAYTTPGGARRFRVRYRTGGRESRPQSAGSFATRREAEARARWVAGELAAMRPPDLRIFVPQEAAETLGELVERYLATRVDATQATTKTYRQAIARLGGLAGRPALDVTVPDLQDWVAEMAAAGLAPATIRLYLDPVRGALDFADVAPNPARSPKLRLPRRTVEEVSPPTLAHLEALLAAIAPRYRLHVRLLEATGLRVGELVALTWGDVDFLEGRLRVARGRTKGRTAGRRWVPLPQPLLEDLVALRAPEDRELGAPVFPGLSDQGLRLAMERACKHAGIPHYHPHDLRHRYISLLVLGGLPLPLVRQLAGHGRASVTLDVYSHVLLDEPRESLERAMRCATGETS